MMIGEEAKKQYEDEGYFLLPNLLPRPRSSTCARRAITTSRNSIPRF